MAVWMCGYLKWVCSTRRCSIIYLFQETSDETLVSCVLCEIGGGRKSKSEAEAMNLYCYCDDYD